MKRIIKMVSLFAILLIVILVNSKNVYGASASLTGPDTVRGGDTITLRVVISDSGKYGFEGTLSYNSNQVTLTKAEANIRGWKLENNGNNIIAYDDAMENPIGNGSTVAILTFKVNNGVKEGDRISISINGFTTTDGNNESSLGTVSYSVTVAKPLSTDASLVELGVSGYVLSPSFNKDTYTYSISDVDYSVKSLKIVAVKSDANAVVSISGNNLSVGANTVTVTVKAESGTTKTYKINVARKQDPNYKASSDASLKELTVSNGKLSPAFSKDVTQYIVYVPYEDKGSKLTISGKANDGKAKKVANSTIEALVEGSNITKVICTAEDGTTKEYTITVVVMPEFNGSVPGIEDATGEAEKPTEEVTAPTEETTTSQFEEETSALEPVEKAKEKKPNVVLIILLVLLVAMAIGGGCYVLFSKEILR